MLSTGFLKVLFWGPYFFIIFINDLPNVFKNVNNINLNVYADDTSLTVYANSDVELTKLLQIYMDKLKYWFDINNLKLNIQKTKILPYFNTKLTNDITIDNIKIDIVDNYKLLGLYLDTKLSFNIHIDNLNMKLSKIIYIIKRLSYLNITNLILLYNSLFLSNLTYGIEIWGNIYNYNLNILNLSQKKIIRIINKKIIDNSKLPLIRLSHTSILFYNSNILKLDDLITFRNILIIYNLLNNKYVNDITDYFKFNRNKTKFILPLMKTNRFHNTIFFKGPNLYNLIMFNNILKTNTITHTLKLKKVLKSFIIKQYC